MERHDIWHSLEMYIYMIRIYKSGLKYIKLLIQTLQREAKYINININVYI